MPSRQRFASLVFAVLSTALVASCQSESRELPDAGAPADASAPPDTSAPADANAPIGVDLPTAGMQLWLRGDTGLHHTSGIDVWADQSGHNRDASMTDTSLQPFYVAGAANGLPMARFTGAETMRFADHPAPTDYTIFIVGQNTNPFEEFGIILGPGGSSPNNQLRWESGTEALVVGTGNGTPAVTSTIGDTRVLHALAMKYDGATLQIYRDGTSTSSASYVATGPLEFGSLGSFFLSSDFLEGDLAEIIIYDRPLAEDERLEVDGYLRGKYQLP
jgi:hypothetical protein